jgi:hypothetical protein
VTRLRVEQPKPWSADPSKWQVVLHWSAPTPAPDHYEVIRNDKIIARDASGESYTDTSAEPATHYTYRVEGMGADGGAGAPETTKTTTGAPSLAAARLEGKFFATLSVTSSTIGASSGGDRWTFVPKCVSGACDVTFTHVGTKVSGTLRQRGASYSGTMSLPFHIRNCYGAAVNESITMHLTISDASVFRGGWRATHIEGTVHEYLAYSGCIAATTDYTVKGSVQT